MSEYHYFYILGDTAEPAREVIDALYNMIRAKGAEVKEPKRLQTAERRHVKQVLEYKLHPSDKMCNWLLHIEPSILREHNAPVHAYTMRFKELVGVSIPELLGKIDIPDEVTVNVRLRQAGHRSAGSDPFSYDYHQDYYTEP